jgi:hypothetical protein
MRLRMFVVAALAAFSGCISPLCQNARSPGQYSESVARVGDGSGFVAEWNGAVGVITAWHVVSDHQEIQIQVTCNGHQEMVGPFRRVGGRTDVAWCRMARLPFSWRPLRTVNVQGPLGKCVAYGYPTDYGRLVAMECEDRGRADNASHAASYPDSHFRAFRGVVTTGMSGGPIINNDVVVAVISHTDFPVGLEHYGAELPQ